MAFSSSVLPLVFLLALPGADPDPAAEAVAAFRASLAGEPATIEAAVERSAAIRKTGDTVLELPAGEGRTAAFHALAGMVASAQSEEVVVAAHNLLARGFFLEEGARELGAVLLAAKPALSRRVADERRGHRRRCAAGLLSLLEAAPKKSPEPWPVPNTLRKLVDHIEQGEWGAAHFLAENSPVLAIPDEESAGRILEAFRRRQPHAADLLLLIRPAERLARMLTEVAVMMSDAPDEKAFATCERMLRRGAIESGVLTPDQAFAAIGPALLEVMKAGPQSSRSRRSALLLARIPSLPAVRALLDAIRDGRTDSNVLQQVGHPDAVPDLLELLREKDRIAAPGIIRALGNCGAPGKQALRKILLDSPGHAIVGLETFCPLVTDREDFMVIEKAAVRFEAESRHRHGASGGEPFMVARMWRVIRGRTTYCANNPEAARAAVDFLDRHPGARIEPALFDILLAWPPEIVAPVLDDLARSRPNEKDLVRKLRERVAAPR